jgi:tetratricopeptide (TPR) repeat protein
VKSASSAIFILGLLAGSILFPGSAHAGQSRIDSLQSALKTAKHDTSRVGILLAWAEAMYMTKPDSALLLWEQALRICKSSPGSADSKVKAHLLRSQAEAVNNMGYIFNSKGDVIKAREYYEESLRLRKLSGDKKGVAEAVNNLGFTFYNQGDIARAIEYFLHSMQLWEDLGEKGPRVCAQQRRLYL